MGSDRLDDQYPAEVQDDVQSACRPEVLYDIRVYTVSGCKGSRDGSGMPSSLSRTRDISNRSIGVTVAEYSVEVKKRTEEDM